MTVNEKPVFAQVAERVVWTFVQAFLVAWFAGGAVFDWTVSTAALAAGVAAVVTLALNAVQNATIPQHVGFYTDAGLRVARSASAAFLAFLLVEPEAILTGRVWEGAAGAAAVAALAAVKAVAARVVGNPSTAATLPVGMDPWLPKGDVFPEPERIEPGEIPDDL